MRFKWMVIVAVLTLGFSTGTAVAQLENAIAIAGEAANVNPATRSFQVGALAFHVPEDVSEFSEVRTGTRVVVQYESMGGVHTVKTLEIVIEPD